MSISWSISLDGTRAIRTSMAKLVEKNSTSPGTYEFDGLDKTVRFYHSVRSYHSIEDAAKALGFVITEKGAKPGGGGSGGGDGQALAALGAQMTNLQEALKSVVRQGHLGLDPGARCQDGHCELFTLRRSATLIGNFTP